MTRRQENHAGRPEAGRDARPEVVGSRVRRRRPAPSQPQVIQLPCFWCGTVVDVYEDETKPWKKSTVCAGCQAWKEEQGRSQYHARFGQRERPGQDVYRATQSAAREED
jgi:hypothetical protein